MEIGAICGMTESEFWDSTPRYLSACVEAVQQRQQLSWEQSRYIAFHAIKVGDTKNKLRKLTDLNKFPWEVSTPRPINRMEMTEFSDDADEILRITNPTIYAALQAAKQQENGK
jgi:hypothetical protein